MGKNSVLTIVACLLVLAALSAADVPKAEISNGSIKATLYLPDLNRGYYRATRFDWSGVIASLEYMGHNYFGQWFERYDPKIHDSISGPVEEFAALGYSEASPGSTFIKIGVGSLRRTDQPISRFFTYDILNPGKWSIKKGPNFVDFTHKLTDSSGYAYIYYKKVSLTKARPELVLEHRLKNVGSKTIETNVYNHNFFVIDHQLSGPNFVIKFPFNIRANPEPKGLAECRGNELAYIRELQKDERIQTTLLGFGNSADDYDIKIENRKTRAGVRIRGDRPLARLVFWSIRTVFSPEAYINVRVEPGGEFAWQISYELYESAVEGN